MSSAHELLPHRSLTRAAQSRTRSPDVTRGLTSLHGQANDAKPEPGRLTTSCPRYSSSTILFSMLERCQLQDLIQATPQSQSPLLALLDLILNWLHLR